MSSNEDEQFSIRDSSEDLNFSEPDEPAEECEFKDLSIGNWLLIKFPGKKF